MKKNIIITGNPRSGKSTLLWNIASGFEKKVGFVSHELREAGTRIGFEIETHAAEKVVLASTKIPTNVKVSKYFIDIQALDMMIERVSHFGNQDMLYLDEIGQMELYSEQFKKLVNTYLNSDNICLASLTKVYRDDFTEQLKMRDDIVIVEITEESRSQKRDFIQALITKIEKAGKYVREPKRFSIGADKGTMTSEHGERTFHKENEVWQCDCNFFSIHNMCSHSIALEEYLKLFPQKLTPTHIPQIVT